MNGHLITEIPWIGSSGYPDPDLLIGAGHSTHLSLIAAQRARGGKTIVLMKPSLPTFFFDLCIIPEHDRAPQAKNVLVTQGVLNAVQSSTKLSPRRGLILIGGPSKHFGWSDTGIAAQVKEIISSTPETDWTLTTSRRTPAGFLQIASELKASNLRIVPVEDTKQGWVTKQMATSGQIWVSEESASMIYEALSSGAGVGLLSCPSQRPSRITEGVLTLKYKGYVTPFSSWRPGDALQAPPETLAEADRCARWIAERWFGMLA